MVQNENDYHFLKIRQARARLAKRISWLHHLLLHTLGAMITPQVQVFVEFEG